MPARDLLPDHHEGSAGEGLAYEQTSAAPSASSGRPMPGLRWPALSALGSQRSAAHAARRLAQVAAFPGRLRRMLLIGMALVLLFYVLDRSYPWPAYVELGPGGFLRLRLAWLAFYAGLLGLSYVRQQDERMQIGLALGIILGTSAMLGVLCAHTGRMISPFYVGLTVVLAMSTLALGGSFLRTLLVSLLALLVWLAFTCGWPARLPRPGWAGWRGTTSLVMLAGLAASVIYVQFLAERLALGLEAAKLLGRYRLVRRIGGGGMGTIYLAEHAALRRQCAVKVLRGGASDPQMVSRFLREAMAASQLRHPNTISVFDYGVTDDGDPYYVMEYLFGEDLQDLVREKGRLPPARVVYLLDQAARSLSEAHARGMVHRDIKPGNLFVTAMGGYGDFLKVLDFGLVKWSGAAEGLTQPQAVMGTPLYMAPEAWSGNTDTRTDVYGLGAVGCFLLCGKPPTPGLAASPGALTALLAGGEPPPSAELIAVLQRCLEPDPLRRFADAGELVEALARTPERGQWLPPLHAPAGPDPGSDPVALPGDGGSHRLIR